MAWIPLLRRDRSVKAFTVVDDDDFDWLNQWTWRADRKFVAYRVESTEPYHHITIYVHREVLGLPRNPRKIGDEREVDHIDGDPLNNRRSNLRIVTHAQNTQNVPSRGGTSIYRGVSLDSRRGTWQAYGFIKSKKHFIGSFTDEDAAGEAASRWRQENMTHNNEERRVA